jgi:hypothetical protein
MEEYTLMNWFTDKYETGGRRRMRLRNVQILVVESFVLKKKREYETPEEDGAPVRVYWRNDAS